MSLYVVTFEGRTDATPDQTIRIESATEREAQNKAIDALWGEGAHYAPESDDGTVGRIWKGRSLGSTGFTAMSGTLSIRVALADA